MFSSCEIRDWSGYLSSFGVVKRGKFVLSSILYGASMILMPGIKTSSKSSEGMSWYFPAYLQSNWMRVCFPVFYFPATKTETFSVWLNPIWAFKVWRVFTNSSIKSFLNLLSWVNLTTLYFLEVSLCWASVKFFSGTVSILERTETIWTLFFLHAALKSESIQI